LPEATFDPYLDPVTGLLRNLIGAHTQEALDAAEADFTFFRATELMQHDGGRRPTGDLRELQTIHRQLFQDVYPWAGQIRTVDISKPGGQPFLPVSMIERSAGYIADELVRENLLAGLSRDRFIERLAYFYDEVNYLHQFREGNGRTARVFWDRIARAAGYRLDWRTVHGHVNDTASRIAAEQHDLRPLRGMFDRIVTKAGRPGTGRDAARLESSAPSQSRRSTATGGQEPHPRPPATGSAHHHGRGPGFES